MPVRHHLIGKHGELANSRKPMMTGRQRKIWFWGGGFASMANPLWVASGIWLPVATWERVAQTIISFTICAIAIWDIVQIRRDMHRRREMLKRELKGEVQ